MQTWLKYAVAFFSFVVLLTIFIFVFGPSQYRQEVKDGDKPFRPAMEHEFQTPGQPAQNK